MRYQHMSTAVSFANYGYYESGDLAAERVQSMLARLEQDGWELVAVQPDFGGYRGEHLVKGLYLFLKRPVDA